MTKRNIHVMAGIRGGWAVHVAGADRASRVFKTQEEATRYGRQMARRENGEFYVHGRDGTVRERNSYSGSARH
ncbi:MAG: DUF2188 domain-containing protein [Bauldia sp.]|nr:DUF2188 domain-containing protein [Bauldia sp.]